MKGFCSFLTNLWGKLSNANAGAEWKSPSVTFSRSVSWTGYKKKMIELAIARFEFTPASTLGALYRDSEFLCYVLEDAIRKEKVYGKTAIPRGQYAVDFTWSGRFNCQLPLLTGVPLFSGIRFHAGNAVTDTDGCLLPGFDRYRSGDEIKVYRSKEAMEKLILPIFKESDFVTLKILGGFKADEMTKGAA